MQMHDISVSVLVSFLQLSFLSIYFLVSYEICGNSTYNFVRWNVFQWINDSLGISWFSALAIVAVFAKKPSLFHLLVRLLTKFQPSILKFSLRHPPWFRKLSPTRYSEHCELGYSSTSRIIAPLYTSSCKSLNIYIHKHTIAPFTNY